MKWLKWRFRSRYYHWKARPFTRLKLEANLYTFRSFLRLGLAIWLFGIDVQFFWLDIRAEYAHPENCECDQCIPF